MPKTTSGPPRSVGRFRYSTVADRDIEGILRFTGSEFGPRQRDRYAALIDRAAGLVAADPNRPGTRSRDDLAPGVRSFSVEQAVRRRGAAAHVLYYRGETLDDRRDGVIILRVLHERMDPGRHLIEEQ